MRALVGSFAGAGHRACNEGVEVHEWIVGALNEIVLAQCQRDRPFPAEGLVSGPSLQPTFDLLEDLVEERFASKVTTEIVEEDFHNGCVRRRYGG